MEKMEKNEELIYQRHSTRSFNPEFLITRENEERILKAGCRAPSPKNRQPWKFVVLSQKTDIQKASETLTSTLIRLKNERKQRKQDDADLNMALATAEIVREVSMLVFVCYLRDENNEHEDSLDWPLTAQGFEVADLQSIGACVENMLLTAEAIGISSLWICDVLYAHRELSAEFHINEPFVAAVAFGKASERQTTRVELSQKVTWFNGTNE